MGLNESNEVTTCEPPDVSPEIVPNNPLLKRNNKRRVRRQTLEDRKARIVTLAAQHVPVAEIAKAVDVPRSTVRDIIKRFSTVFTALPKVNDYREVKANLLAAGQLAALESAMNPKKMAKASFISTLQGFKILNEAERLERGQSTANIAHGFSSTSLDALLSGQSAGVFGIENSISSDESKPPSLENGENAHLASESESSK